MFHVFFYVAEQNVGGIQWYSNWWRNTLLLTVILLFRVAKSWLDASNDFITGSRLMLHHISRVSVLSPASSLTWYQTSRTFLHSKASLLALSYVEITTVSKQVIIFQWFANRRSFSENSCLEKVWQDKRASFHQWKGQTAHASIYGALTNILSSSFFCSSSLYFFLSPILDIYYTFWY